MYIDPTVTYLIFQQEHEIRIAQAQRNRQAEYAVRAAVRHSVLRAIGRHAGAALVRVGERLQGISQVQPAGNIADPAIVEITPQ